MGLGSSELPPAAYIGQSLRGRALGLPINMVMKKTWTFIPPGKPQEFKFILGRFLMEQKSLPLFLFPNQA